MPERPRCLFLVLLLALLPGSASTVQGQVPDRIPSDQEAQIFHLICRVTFASSGSLSEVSSPLRRVGRNSVREFDRRRGVVD
jgi:hypothetical protein